MTLLFLVFITIFNPSYCFARFENRYFTLVIENKSEKSIKVFDSTLTPEQYKTFYPLKKSETITYIDTWECDNPSQNFYSHPSENCSGKKVIDSKMASQN